MPSKTTQNNRALARQALTTAQAALQEAIATVPTGQGDDVCNGAVATLQQALRLLATEQAEVALLDTQTAQPADRYPATEE